MNRLQLRAPKALRRRPYRARRAPQHHDVVAAVLDTTPVPRSMVVLTGVVGASVAVELFVALAVLA